MSICALKKRLAHQMGRVCSPAGYSSPCKKRQLDYGRKIRKGSENTEVRVLKTMCFSAVFQDLWVVVRAALLPIKKPGRELRNITQLHARHLIRRKAHPPSYRSTASRRVFFIRIGCQRLVGHALVLVLEKGIGEGGSGFLFYGRQSIRKTRIPLPRS